MLDSTIDGVVLKQLKTHADSRGFFREVIRVTDDYFEAGFGQWSHSIVYTGAIKAWHLHNIQDDYWYVPVGVLQVALHDLRKDSPTYKETMEFTLGEHQEGYMLKIPPGVAHGCKAIQGPVHMIYLTSHTYDPDDELRIAHDDPEIGFDWTKQAIG